MIGHSSKHCRAVTSLPRECSAAWPSVRCAVHLTAARGSASGVRTSFNMENTHICLQPLVKSAGLPMASSMLNVRVPASPLERIPCPLQPVPGGSHHSSILNSTSSQAADAGDQISRQPLAIGQTLELECTALAFGGQVCPPACMIIVMAP